MKRIFALFLVLVYSTSNAQIKFGGKAGVNVSMLGGMDVYEKTAIHLGDRPSNALYGVSAGGYAYYNFVQPRWLGVQAEVLFSMQGGKNVNYYANGINHPIDKLRQNYINIPFIIRFNLSKIPLTFLLGSQIGFCVVRYLDGKNMSKENDKNSIYKKSTFNNGIDNGLILGLQYMLTDNLVIDLRGILAGRYTITNDETMSWVGKEIPDNYVFKSEGANNIVVQLTLGWTF